MITGGPENRPVGEALAELAALRRLVAACLQAIRRSCRICVFQVSGGLAIAIPHAPGVPECHDDNVAPVHLLIARRGGLVERPNG
jgi:hypothetical protein